MVQDIRTEQVFEELNMTSAKSESALWSILGFYFSIIFGLLAVLILLKTVKIGRFLDFSISNDNSPTEATESDKDGEVQPVSPSTSQKAISPAGGRKTKDSKYAQPPKALNGTTNKDSATSTTKAKKASKLATKTVSSTSAPSTSPVRVGTAFVNPIVSKTPASTKRKPEALSTGRKKAKKDPDAPKRPLSAYLMFQNDKRAELIQQNPTMTSTEISVLASHMWKNELTEEQKKPYLEKEGARREQYKIDSTIYQAKKASEEPMEVDETQEGTVVDKKGEKSPRRPKDPNAPKRPRTAFLVYNSNAEIRKALKDEFPEASPRDLMRMLGERWAAMKPEDKEKYEDVAKQEQTIYKVEKETYQKMKAADQGQRMANDTEPTNVNSSEEESQQTEDATKDESGESPAKETTKKTPAKTPKSSSKKKTPITKAKKSPVKKRTPVAKVPILSAARALRSGKRKTRSKTP